MALGKASGTTTSPLPVTRTPAPVHTSPRPVAVHTPAPNPSHLPASAKAIVQGFLSQFGLQGLVDWGWDLYKKLGGGQVALDTIQFELPNQAAFKARFPAYATLQKQGHPMTPAQIVQYEQQARDLLRQAGAPPDLMGSNYIQARLAAGVSISELSNRVQIAQQAAQSPHETIQALQRLYGLDQNHLTSFFLDPDVMLPKLQSMFQSGQIAGDAAQQGFGPLSQSEAERLASQGVTDAQAQQGFGQLASQQGLLEAQQAGEGQAKRADELGLVSGLGAAQQAFKQRQANRLAPFAGTSGGFNVGQNGVTGLGSNG